MAVADLLIHHVMSHHVYAFLLLITQAEKLGFLKFFTFKTVGIPAFPVFFTRFAFL